MKVRAIIFDLDGTLVDSSPEILSTVGEVCKKYFGVEINHDQASVFVGPPLRDSLVKVVPGLQPTKECSDPRVNGYSLEDAIAEYRRIYESKMYDSRLFAGAIPALKKLDEYGVVLAIATSKPQVLADAVLNHIGLTDLFTVRCGGTLDASGDAKDKVVARALRELAALEKIDLDQRTEQVLMVGDRCFDTVGARANDLYTVLGTWAHTAEAEEYADCWRTVDSFEQLVEIVLVEKG